MKNLILWLRATFRQWVHRARRGLAGQGAGPASGMTFQMNDFSADARNRTQLFTSVATREGAEVLPGRYGGEFNNDMLALGRTPDGTEEVLLLGLKVSDESGNLQLDLHSMGPYRQLSRAWLRLVVHALQGVSRGQAAGERIAQALAQDRLIVGMMWLDRNDLNVKIVRMSLD